MGKGFQKVLKLFSEPQTQHISEEYLKKYWLDERELQNYWQPLRDKIFCSKSSCLPDVMFKENFELIVLMGGVIFTKNDFEALQNCMFKAGDKWFVVVENKYTQPVITGNDGQVMVHPLLHFKFPIEITWKELLNGGLVSMELFETSYKEFFVFGNSAKWGKYAANEYWNALADPAGTPLDIIGFKPELAPIFREYFKQSKEDQEEIREWLPQKYKKLIKEQEGWQENR